jgi:(1->4)-alpha-D-glucan 1-alpha-D-glucosylmutase
VDPDNRRPVDFENRRKFLNELQGKNDDTHIKIFDELLRLWTDGRIKLILIFKVLNARRNHAELFDKGNYQPLTIRGTYSDHVVGYIRSYKNQSAATIVPRFMTSLIGENELPHGINVWKNTEMLWPQPLDGNWRDVITGECIRINKSALVGDILSRFPVSLLIK